jgi:hypothetical protein
VAGIVPVGLAAAADTGAAANTLSGPSPPADMMATSLVAGAAPYLAGGISYSPSNAGLVFPGAMGASPSASPHPYGSSMGMSPAYGDALMHHHRAVAGSSAGGASPLGTSPMPMSFTPYEGGAYMQQVPAQLNQAAAAGGGKN